MIKPMMILNVPPFGFDVGIFVSVEDYEAYFAETHAMEAPTVDRANAAAVHFTHNDKAWFAAILPEGTALPKVAHEMVHIADYAMAAAGAPTGAKNTELRGYIVERLMEQLQSEENDDA